MTRAGRRTRDSIILTIVAGGMLVIAMLAGAEQKPTLAPPTGECPTGQVKGSGGECATPPPLSTAEQIAINSLEQRKKEAFQAYQQADGQEQQVMADWAKAHQGWRIDPTKNFQVIPDLPAPAKESGKK